MLGRVPGLAAVLGGAYFFGVDELRAGMERYTTPALILLFGSGGMANAKRLGDRDNFETVPYGLTLLVAIWG